MTAGRSPEPSPAQRLRGRVLLVVGILSALVGTTVGTAHSIRLLSSPDPIERLVAIFFVPLAVIGAVLLVLVVTMLRRDLRKP